MKKATFRLTDMEDQMLDMMLAEYKQDKKNEKVSKSDLVRQFIRFGFRDFNRFKIHFES